MFTALLGVVFTVPSFLSFPAWYRESFALASTLTELKAARWRGDYEYGRKTGYLNYRVLWIIHHGCLGTNNSVIPPSPPSKCPFAYASSCSQFMSCNSCSSSESCGWCSGEGCWFCWYLRWVVGSLVTTAYHIISYIHMKGYLSLHPSKQVRCLHFNVLSFRRLYRIISGRGGG